MPVKHISEGDKRCRHHRGLIRINTRECCGGRKHQFAVIKCSVLGEVEVGKKPCDSWCKNHTLG